MAGAKEDPKEGTRAKAVPKVVRTKGVHEGRAAEGYQMWQGQRQASSWLLLDMWRTLFASDCPWMKSRTYQSGHCFLKNGGPHRQSWSNS